MKSAPGNWIFLTKHAKQELRFFDYGTREPLPVQGTRSVTLQCKDCTTTRNVYIVNDWSDALLSFSAAIALSLVHILYTVQEAPAASTVADYVIKYPQLFQGVGLVRNMTAHLHTDASVTPVAQPCRRIPFPLRKQVEAELGRPLQEDIIEPADGPTPWVSPLVVVPKPHNLQEIRMCMDIRCANQVIARERHLTPTVVDSIILLNGAAVFSRLNCRRGASSTST